MGSFDGEKRRTYLVEKAFQVRFILRFCMIVGLGILVSTSLLFFLSQDTLTSSFENSRLVVEQTGFAILPAIIYTNLITLCIVILAVIFVTLYMSHKIAGPLFRFGMELEHLQKGDLTRRFNLRKADQLSGVADRMNGMADALREKLLAIQYELEALEASAHSTEVPQELQERIQRLQQMFEKQFII